ncbi:hypothetical protein BDV96DRAFT_23105 [Lophiotrema nucula]|uniref:Uncharacterized protein n=1 Tax=Lophiotrema nucula TaxID=690887 RepID=A0A6A5ZCM6_9PLEO|nr:hypothetical protein BDV96DRAFT_23105 [Lophiotrema nucula]
MRDGHTASGVPAACFESAITRALAARTGAAVTLVLSNRRQASWSQRTGGAFTCFQSGAQEWDNAVVVLGRGPCNRGNIPGARTFIMVDAKSLPGGAAHAGGNELSAEADGYGAAKAQSLWSPAAGELEAQTIARLQQGYGELSCSRRWGVARAASECTMPMPTVQRQRGLVGRAGRALGRTSEGGRCRGDAVGHSLGRAVSRADWQERWPRRKAQRRRRRLEEAVATTQRGGLMAAGLCSSARWVCEIRDCCRRGVRQRWAEVEVSCAQLQAWPRNWCARWLQFFPAMNGGGSQLFLGPGACDWLPRPTSRALLPSI